MSQENSRRNFLKKGLATTSFAMLAVTQIALDKKLKLPEFGKKL